MYDQRKRIPERRLGEIDLDDEDLGWGQKDLARRFEKRVWGVVAGSPINSASQEFTFGTP